MSVWRLLLLVGIVTAATVAIELRIRRERRRKGLPQKEWFED